MSLNRRAFMQHVAGLGGATLVSAWTRVIARQRSPARVAFVKTPNRADGVTRALALLRLQPWRGRRVFLKPNFNSADPPPGSTHQETLAALITALRGLNAGAITVGDRSGMGDTRQVMESKNVFGLARDLDVRAIVLDELPADEWQTFDGPGTHWRRGFALPRPALASDAIVQTCCLKTHRFGGHFTLSLKNSVGLAAKHLPGDSYNFMGELHGSPSQRVMIAEINAVYQPALIVLDGVEAFVEGGPDQGKLVKSEVMLAGTDRVAIDAVGVALLRHHGTTAEVSAGRIFDQAQLKRAVELGLGASGSAEIELLTDSRESATYAAAIRAVLDAP